MQVNHWSPVVGRNGAYLRRIEQRWYCRLYLNIKRHKEGQNSSWSSLWSVCVDLSLTPALCLGSTKGSAVVETVKVTFARQTRWHWPKPMLTVGLFRSLILKSRFGRLPAEHKHHPRCPPTSSGHPFPVSEVEFGTLNIWFQACFIWNHLDDRKEKLIQRE